MLNIHDIILETLHSNTYLDYKVQIKPQSNSKSLWIKCKETQTTSNTLMELGTDIKTEKV